MDVYSLKGASSIPSFRGVPSHKGNGAASQPLGVGPPQNVHGQGQAVRFFPADFFETLHSGRCTGLCPPITDGSIELSLLPAISKRSIREAGLEESHNGSPKRGRSRGPSPDLTGLVVSYDGTALPRTHSRRVLINKNFRILRQPIGKPGSESFEVVQTHQRLPKREPVRGSHAHLSQFFPGLKQDEKQGAGSSNRTHESARDVQIGLRDTLRHIIRSTQTRELQPLGMRPTCGGDKPNVLNRQQNTLIKNNTLKMLEESRQHPAKLELELEFEHENETEAAIDVSGFEEAKKTACFSVASQSDVAEHNRPSVARKTRVLALCAHYIRDCPHDLGLGDREAPNIPVNDRPSLDGAQAQSKVECNVEGHTEESQAQLQSKARWLLKRKPKGKAKSRPNLKFDLNSNSNSECAASARPPLEEEAKPNAVLNQMNMKMQMQMRIRTRTRIQVHELEHVDGQRKDKQRTDANTIQAASGNENEKGIGVGARLRLKPELRTKTRTRTIMNIKTNDGSEKEAPKESKARKKPRRLPGVDENKRGNVACRKENNEPNHRRGITEIHSVTFGKYIC